MILRRKPRRERDWLSAHGHLRFRRLSGEPSLMKSVGTADNARQSHGRIASATTGLRFWFRNQQSDYAVDVEWDDVVEAIKQLKPQNYRQGRLDF